MSDSLQTHGLQYTRPPCLSPTSGIYSNFMSIESVMPSNHLILCCPLLLLCSIFPSIRVFSNESFLRMMWPEYWSFSFSISPSSDYSRQIFFRIDWFDLLEVQVTLKSFLQHHSSKASILPVLSFLYSPTLTSIHDYWKNHSFDYILMVEKKKTMVYSRDGSYSFYWDVAWVISAHITFYRASHMVRPCVSGVGSYCLAPAHCYAGM